MIRYLKHEEIDKKKWDAAIMQSVPGLIYPYSWYLDAVSPGWDALIKDDYDFLMPLTWRKKYTVSYLFQPYFVQQLGVFGNIRTPFYINSFLRELPAHFKYIDINLNYYNRYQGHQFRITENRNFELCLDRSYYKLANNYSDNTKRNIKKALGKNLKIVSGKDGADEICELFRRHQGKKHPALKKEYYALFGTLSASVTRHTQLLVYKCYAQSAKLIAGTVFFIHNNRAALMFTGNTDAGRASGAMHLLIDRFISDHASSGVILDFEGSNQKGLGRFYKSFGSKDYLYLRLKQNNLPAILRKIKQ